jgi:hypothetical protein
MTQRVSDGVRKDVETRGLYEVINEVTIGQDDVGNDIVLEVGSRIWIYEHPCYEWPIGLGFDIALYDFDNYFKLIKVDKEWH